MDILSEARVGELSDKSYNILYNHMLNPPSEQTVGRSTTSSSQRSTSSSSQAASPPTPSTPGSPSPSSRKKIAYTKLECKNVDVDAQNQRELQKLQTETHGYIAEDYNKTDYAAKLLANFQAPKDLQLKVGAQVMLLKNINPKSGLVNGSRGTVLKFVDWEIARNQEIMNGSALETDIPRTWSRETKLPYVEFHDPGSDDTIKMYVWPAIWDISDHNDLLAKRTQLPLRLAWSLSIHKVSSLALFAESSFPATFSCYLASRRRHQTCTEPRNDHPVLAS